MEKKDESQPCPFSQSEKQPETHRSKPHTSRRVLQGLHKMQLTWHKTTFDFKKSKHSQQALFNVWEYKGGFNEKWNGPSDEYE